MGSRRHTWIDLLDGPMAGKSEVRAHPPRVGESITAVKYEGPDSAEAYEYRVTAKAGKRYQAVHVRALGPVVIAPSPAPSWNPYGPVQG